MYQPLPNDKPDMVKTLSDLALVDIQLKDYPVVESWRNQLFSPEGLPEICDELPRLLTEFYRQNRNLSPRLARAQALYHVFSQKTPLVRKTDLLPGQTTTSFVGPVVYPDMIGYCIWPELKTVEQRKENPFKIKKEVAERLNKEIFPFWLEYLPVQEIARASAYNTKDYENDGRDMVKTGEGIDPPLAKKAGETPRCQFIFERVAFFLSDKATCVSHTVPDFDRVLKYGLKGLQEQIQKDLHELPLTDEQKEFLKGVHQVFDGAIRYAQNLAKAAETVGNTDLATICRKVPEYPATTLHEAVCTIWICYHLLLQENTNFGLSLGRLDQLLNPFYLSDWQKINGEKQKNAYINRAVEIICHFFLRCCDHVPLSTEGSEKLFAGSGSNQALTVGGVKREKGKTVNAVNDMTYIILKATELLAVRDPNIHARYHAEIHRTDNNGKALPQGEYDAYLKRICQVNILTGATPAIHGDVPVIESMKNYYSDHQGINEEEAQEDAHDYASIGCIEQNSAGKHYGNTGSTLLVLPAVLELALFGGKHRSDGIGADDPNLIYETREFTSPPLTKMKSMDEFIAAFSFQLNEMARMTCQCNNYFGRFLEKRRASPFLSGLFTGPANVPDGQGAQFRDLAAGGAKYNSAGVAIIGVADVIDSFCMLDTLIFNGPYSVNDLIQALQSNFGEIDANANTNTSIFSIFQRFVIWLKQLFGSSVIPPIDLPKIKKLYSDIRYTPKYGAGIASVAPYDNSLAVKYTKLITKIIFDTYYQYRTHRGGRYLAGYWSMTNHAGFGMLTKATPNGRKNGESFAGGITPCPGVVKGNGDPVLYLDHMSSVASVPSNYVKNGYTYNLSLTPRGPDNFVEDTDLFAEKIFAFMSQGGMLVQMCVHATDYLQKAHEAANQAATMEDRKAAEEILQPYNDIMVRVAGYSAYYVTMSALMRQEIIDRANFHLAR